ncbi:MAG: putative tail tube protein [Prokaryotic dsDNA virus sp.]|nr:MAG: putative tail tube protein [Prokaryotic dsDNA virus sp.]|tara:strand:- start:779 stop:1192 length:414 start_codon:yes stop_codon:yes gene_type:complete
MAGQKGSELLVKVGNGGSPESFTTVGGLRDTSISINQEMLDITNKDSARVRTLLAQSGVKSFSISGSGVFTDSASEATVIGTLDASSFTNYQFLVPDFKTFTGAFQLTAVEYAGSYTGEVTYSLTWESAGAITIASV